MALEGEATILIRPDTSRFAAELTTQLNAAMAQVQNQFNNRFKTLGQTAGQGLGQGFSQQVTPAIRQATQRTAATLKPVMHQAGVVSGQVFGQGVGEGFAALAAFAIASQVRRFFAETAQAALDFESSLAGVRRTVDVNEEGFQRLRGEIVEMARTLPFAVTEIAKVASEAGRLGVEAPNIQAFTETILKLSTVTGASQDQLAGDLARFTTVTQRSLGEVEGLSDVLLKLDTASAASATEILQFTQRLAPLAGRTSITAEEILGLATGLRQAGVQADAGGTAITRTVDAITNAAIQGGSKLVQFSELLGVTTDQFKEMAVNDPSETLLRFLEAIQAQGLAGQATLADFGLGADRITRSVTALSASVGTLREFMNGTSEAAGTLNEQFNIFAQTDEQRIATLRNQFQQTRIEIGGKLVPALLAYNRVLAGLSTPTVSLGLAAAGVAALGFTFNRLSNILKSVGSSLGGANLTTAQFNLVMAEARRQGVGFNVILQQLKQGTVEFASATEGGVATTIRATGAETARTKNLTSFTAAFRAARAEQKAFAAEQAAAAAASAAIQQRALNSAFGGTAGVLAVPPAAVAPGRLRSIADAADTARQSVGGLSGAVNLLGKAFFAAFAFDIFAQITESAADFFDEMARGKPDVDALNNSMIQLVSTFGTGANQASALAAVLEDARIQQLDGWGQLGTAVSDSLRNIGAGIPGLTGPLGEFAAEWPIIGRLIESSGEKSERVLADLVGGLEKFAETAGPKAAQAVAEFIASNEQFRSSLAAGGVGPEALNEFIEKQREAAAGANFLEQNSDALIASLRALGLDSTEVASTLQALGLGAQAAAAGLQTAAEVSTNLASIVSTVSQAQTDYAAKVRSVAPAFSTFTLESNRGAAAAGRAADAVRNAARRIADAERALADARRDARRQIEDAQRRIADAEVDAARRIADANRRLAEARREALRSSRDTQQSLQDFQRALELRGGAATEEDLIKLRDLEQAASDTFADNAQRVAEAQRVLVQVRIDGDEKIAEARRRLAEVEANAADKIADALRRLAQAQEDAARKSERAAAAGKTATDTMIRTAQQLESNLKKNVSALSGFNTNLETLADRTLNLFKSKEGKGIAAEFLRELQGMGPAAVPLLKDLNNKSDAEIKKLVGIFGNRIKESKRAADLEWDKYQPNFVGKLQGVSRAVNTEARDMLSTFDALIAGGLLEAAEHMRPELDGMAAQIATFAGTSKENLANLSDIIAEFEKRGIHVELELEQENFLKALKRWKDALNEANLKFTVNANGDLVVTGGNAKNINFLSAHGNTIMGSPIPQAANGRTMRPGSLTLLGEYGPELFAANTGGAIFKHTDTMKILRALGASRGGNIYNTTVNEVAKDPEATARSISNILGSQAVD